MFESAASASAVLKVEGLVKIYGTRRVVDGVSFHVNRGEIVGLLGPNGAGKTTSFRMACGLINTNGGIVYLGAQDVTNWPMYRRSRDGGMGYLPQDRSVFQKLSVQNNLHGVMEMLGMKRSERNKRCEELLEKFNLTHLRQSYGGSLSGGERRRLEIARSLVSDPKIILLDEPFAAIDPVTVASIQEIIRKLADDGIAILITDHSVQDTLEITQRSYVIQSGKVLCHGTPSEVLANPEAKKAYFGDKQDRYRAGAHLPPSPPTPIQRQKKAVSHAPTRQIDPEWEVPATEVIMAERERKRDSIEKRGIGEHVRPFHLQFHTPTEPAPPQPTPVLDISVQAATPPKEEVVSSNPGESSIIRSGKRLRPIPTSITSSISPNAPPVAEEEPSHDPGMSSIIRNLGHLIWKK